MTLDFLSAKDAADFKSYCRLHRAEVDDSFLCDEDLAAFTPGSENPTVVAREEGRIVGAASLILDEYMRKGNRARFRIFHAENGNVACYEALFRAILPHTAGVGRLFVYVQEERTPQLAAVKALGFTSDRISFLLLREDKPIEEPRLPEGFTIAGYEPGRDAPAWCAVRNAAFATLKGSETPITEDMADRGNSAAIPGGAMLLKHGGETVGVVRAEVDDMDGPAANIGPLAILPTWQGKGLGRALLRAALRNAKERGYGRAVLCVNGENERAAALYLQEGFRQVEAITCYRYDIGEP